MNRGAEMPQQKASNSSPWIVIKFGGTSVSALPCWENIAAIINERVVEGLRPVIVCSAPSGVSNQLESLIAQAEQGDFEQPLAEIEAEYQALATALDIDFKLLQPHFENLSRLIKGISLLGEASARIQAQVMAYGEILLTVLGAAYLNRKGIRTHWQDARELLIVTPSKNETLPNQYLSARCHVPYQSLEQQLANESESVIITQGFIARNHKNETVLLGRGGSDTSAAYLAVGLGACRCEIWTDVPGIYTANPHQIPEARFLKRLDYDEAQEIASMGAQILHPNCIAPLKSQKIPLHVNYTPDPKRDGSIISLEGDQSDVQIKSILTRYGLTLITIETVRMWQQVGFLADVFRCFKTHGFSIGLVSTSEASVTVSLDQKVNDKMQDNIRAVLDDLNQFAKATVIGPCAAISLVGHNIRAILHQLGDVFEVFEQQRIHLLSQAANDLNLTFVVDEDQAQRIAQQLHALLIEQTAASHYFNQSWQQEFGQYIASPDPWWKSRQKELLAAAKFSPVYVYDENTLQKSVDQLKQCSALDKIFYSMKANNNENILRQFYQAGLGFECVSIDEVEYIFSLFKNIDHTQIIFTPNFAPRQEYEKAFKLGVTVTLDSLYPLECWPEVFANKSIFLRVDPGQGYGHHKYVVTCGGDSKFGVSLSQLDYFKKIAEDNHTQIVGLHTHSGSGILNPERWKETSLILTSLLERFPDVTTIDLGGGFGVVEKSGQKPLDLTILNESLMQVKSAFPKLSLWVEPGRYLVSEAGVLLAKVTQIKEKDGVRFVGIETGMNSLIRPALYGAYHEIINLTRLNELNTQTVNIVGPICETGDTLGYSRLLPKTVEGDILLIANTGAYGYCMSSCYNLRKPAQEYYLANAYKSFNPAF